MSKKKGLAKRARIGLVLDCSIYLELAIRRHLPLATLDDKLKSAAKALGITMYAVR